MIGQTGSDLMAWSDVIVLAIVLIGSGVALTWVGRKAVRGTLRRNAWAGIRTKSTTASDEAWDAAHRAGGELIAWAGYGSVVIGLLLLFRPSNTVGAVMLGGWFVVMMTLMFVSTMKAIRAAKAVG